MTGAGKSLISIALAAVVAAGLATVDLRWFFPEFNTRALQSFTPYFPGLDSLQKHEVFDPRYRDKKKIVILGASNAESLGCDGSLSVDDKSRTPARNVHHTCRVDRQLQALLDAHGYGDWQVFNLARTGAASMAVLLVYLLASETKPNIVINVGGRHFSNRNGDWETLLKSPYQTSFIDALPSRLTGWKTAKDGFG